MIAREPHRRVTRTARLTGLLLLAAVAAGLIATMASGKKVSRKAGHQGPKITGRILLDHSRVRRGGKVVGKLVFFNHTKQTKTLITGCRTDGFYAIALRGHARSLNDPPAFSLVACIPVEKLVARPGRSAHAFAIKATYNQCSQSAAHQPPKSSKYWTPVCLKDARGIRDVMPPLPKGVYRAELVPNGTWHGPTVRPAKLRVTRKK